MTSFCGSNGCSVVGNRRSRYGFSYLYLISEGNCQVSLLVAGNQAFRTSSDDFLV